jgi:hypothetical protein
MSRWPWMLVAMAISLVSVGRADDDAELGDRAVALGREGVTLYNEQRWMEAYDRFALAERTTHSPVFQLYMARCKRNLGALLEAEDVFRTVGSAKLAEDAPKAWHQARLEAQAELELVAERIPTLRIVVEGSRQAEVTVDGKAVDHTKRSALPVDPGTHVVAASAGPSRVARTITVVEKEREREVRLSLGGTRVAGGGVAPTGDARADPSPAEGGSYLPGAIVTSIGAAGLLAGVITGVLALNKAREIEQNCVDNSCLRSDEPAGRNARSLATASTVSFVAGGVLAATGIVLLIVRPGESGAAAVQVTPRGAAVTARF